MKLRICYECTQPVQNCTWMYIKMNYYSKHLCFKLMPQDRKVLLAVVSVSFTAVSAMGCLSLSLSLSFFFSSLRVQHC